MKTIKSATLDYLDALSVDVEATFTKGLPGFSIVGLASSSIQESKDRVKSALLTNDFKFPPKKITINLSPSDINKNGTHFDLSIALQIALHDEKVEFDEFYIFGELGLSGVVRENSTIFPIVLSLAKEYKNIKVIVPFSIASFISMIPSIKVYAIKNFEEACTMFKNKRFDDYEIKNEELKSEKIVIKNSIYYKNDNYELDFNDVKGQENAKKAALISVAGNHNILFEGSPGCGKSMIAKRLQYIMPPSSSEDVLEKAKLDFLNGEKPSFDAAKVFRSPHHSATKASLFGGGTNSSKIGELALANKGILFFDELPHFSKSILEAMREPLEDYKILISRVNSKTNYETKFLFVSAMNPCPCGNLLSLVKDCRCNDIEIARYKNKLSDPFLDRIDLFVTMNDVDLNSKATISSKQMHSKVLSAFTMQKNRGQKELNGKLNDSDIRKYCVLDDESTNILNKATQNFSLSFRSINKVLKVSRTIADLNESNDIKKEHLLEALSYRRR